MLRFILNYDVSKNEFLCPMCGRLCNSVLPLLPPVEQFMPLVKPSEISFYAWCERARNVAGTKVG